MRPSLNEERAWALVRSTPAEGGPVRVPLPPLPGGTPAEESSAAVVVDLDGGWSTSAFVTDGARRVLDLYLPLRRAPSWIVGQMGQSLDGRIATESGHSHYVTGPEDIRRLHRLRALADAVVVGAGTAASDDPRLTVREADGPNPVRVVLDPGRRLDAGLRIFTDGAAPTLRIVGSEADPPTRHPHEPGRAPAPSEGLGDHESEEVALALEEAWGLHPARIVEALRARGLRRILVEGGGVTVSRFLEAGLLDRIHVTVAPLIVGSGRPAFTLEPVATLGEALRPACRTFPLGEDVLFDLDLRGGPGEGGE